MGPLLGAIGVDSRSERLRDTARRVAEAYVELTSGYGIDPKKILRLNSMKSLE
ncbi:MAG: GTP cyclohydrolase I [Nitrososphaerales archaeon]